MLLPSPEGRRRERRAFPSVDVTGREAFLLTFNRSLAPVASMTRWPSWLAPPIDSLLPSPSESGAYLMGPAKRRSPLLLDDDLGLSAKNPASPRA